MVTSDRFRQVLSNFATGVTIVTTRGNDGQAYGLTVNSFTSVSLDPLLVLVCFDNRLSSLQHFRDSMKFAVSILAEGQQDLSSLFAKKDNQRPESLYSKGPNGQPLLRGALAYLECDTVEIYPGGDHKIFLGRVISAEVGDDKTGALLYFRGKYHHL